MKFSIVIPIYNVEKYLKECLDSVVAQTCGDWECICVDDGSTDSSGAIADEYGRRDSRFVVIHQPNGGEGAARNAGLDRCQGDWFVFVDSDDVIRETLLADLNAVLQACPEVDMVNSRAIQFQDGSQPDWKESWENVVGEVWDLRREMHSGVAAVCVCGGCYRRSVFGKIRFGKRRIGADLVYTSQCFSVAKSIGNQMRADYAYRQRTTSISHVRKTPELVREAIAYLPEMFAHYAQSGKRLPSSITRDRGNAWIEGCAAMIADNQDGSDEWERVWSYWFSTLKDAARYQFFTPWQRFVLASLNATQSKPLAMLLCVLPHVLKRKGFHR